MISNYPIYYFRRNNDIIRSRITKLFPVITKYFRRRPDRPISIPAEKDKVFLFIDFVFQPLRYCRIIEQIRSDKIFIRYFFILEIFKRRK